MLLIKAIDSPNSDDHAFPDTCTNKSLLTLPLHDKNMSTGTQAFTWTDCCLWLRWLLERSTFSFNSFWSCSLAVFASIVKAWRKPIKSGILPLREWCIERVLFWITLHRFSFLRSCCKKYMSDWSVGWLRGEMHSWLGCYGNAHVPWLSHSMQLAHISDLTLFFFYS